MDRGCETRMRLHGFHSCLTAWTIGARKVLNILYTTHTWMLGPLMDTIHKSKFYIRDLKFAYNIKISENKLAQSCLSVACSDANSIIGNKIAYFRSQFNISVDMTIYEMELASLKAPGAPNGGGGLNPP